MVVVVLVVVVVDDTISAIEVSGFSVLSIAMVVVVVRFNPNIDYLK